MKVIKFDIQRFVETINGTEGNDTINVEASQTAVFVYGGDDEVWNGLGSNYDSYDQVTIVGGSGSDTIVSGYGRNSSDSVSIVGGADNDNLTVKGNNSTISGDDGNDNIDIYGNINYASGGIGDDYLINSGDSNTILGDSGNDTIYGGSGSYVFIDGGAGNDTIRSIGGSGVTINGGMGDDYLINNSRNKDGLIIGGDGNDYFMIYGSATVNAGAGNDTIDMVSNGSVNAVIYYSNGDGNDIIHGFDTNDTLLIAGTDYSTSTISNELFVNVNDIVVTAGTGKITLVGAADKSLNIQSTSSPTPEPTPTPTPTTSSIYTYTGGNATISAGIGTSSSVTSGYSAYEQINIATDFTGVEVDGDNIILKSSSGKLTIQNSRGKYVKYGDSNSNLVAYSYMGTNEISSSDNSSVGNAYVSYNTIDGRNVGAVYEVLIGGENVDDKIYAGSGGSSLWGGNNGNDTLVGGDGYDEFVYKSGNGSDVIQNAGDNDVVNLSSINLSQISGVEINIGQVNVDFVDGGKLQIQGGSGVAYRIAEGTFVVNQFTKEWSAK
ncbi:MAG: hypothetical protein IKZ58_10580 [Selenomonadaceae bacterium]|nr:hypothetical protein [Selenomonadaceae bacterium]